VVSQRQERMLIAEVRGRSRYLPASDTNRPIRLPSDLARSLQYLDDGELQELQNAVNGELVRRRPRAVSKAPAGQRDKETRVYRSNFRDAFVARSPRSADERKFLDHLARRHPPGAGEAVETEKATSSDSGLVSNDDQNEA
jgi:hypothetical protein